jgi:hypothetical protein
MAARVIPTETEPAMFIKKTEEEHNPVDDLPYLVALPFRVADYTWDLALDATVGTLRVGLAPVFITSSVIKKAASAIKSKAIGGKRPVKP